MEYKDQLIAKYLDHNLSSDEKRDFQHFMNHDSDFKKEVEFYKKTIPQIRAIGEKKRIESVMKEEFKKLEEQGILKDKKPSLFVRSKKLFYITATAAAMLAFFIIISIFLKPTKTGPQLAKTYLSPYKSITSIRGEDNNLNYAINQQAEGNYAVALPILKKNIQSKDSILVFLYAGICEISAHHPDTALAYFNKIKTEQNIKEITNWYSALAYLEKNNKAKAKEILQMIIHSKTNDRKPFMYDKAQQLLKEI